MISKSQWRKFKAGEKQRLQEHAVPPDASSMSASPTSPKLKDFKAEVHSAILQKDYLEAYRLISVAINSNLSELKEKDVLKDILTTIAGLTAQYSPETNAETIKAGIALIKECAERGITYEPDVDNPKVTQTAICLGQDYYPADIAYTIIELLNAGKLVILPSTLKFTAERLQFNNATSENTQAFKDLMIKAFEHYLDSSIDEDTVLVNKALQKLGNPNILPGEENLLDVANRISAGYEIAQLALEKDFRMFPAKRGTRLDFFIEDIRKVAIKLRLLGDFIKSGNLNPTINTNILLNESELQTAKIKQNPEIGDNLIELSNKFLLMALKLTNKGIDKKQVSYGNTLLGTIKECEPSVSTDESQEILQLAENLLKGNIESVNDKSIETIATYLASQEHGGLAAIYLSIAAHRNKVNFSLKSWGFIIMKTKNVHLKEGHLKDEWSYLAGIKGTTDLLRSNRH